ncbi:MAG: SDR family oxidoreductase [Steroidobacteraceae bacterium]
MSTVLITGASRGIGRASRIGARTPLGRPGRAAEIAEAIVWLLSENASYVNGALLDVTGGR